MSFIDYLLGKRKNTADVAKERLHFIIAHERTRRSGDLRLGD